MDEQEYMKLAIELAKKARGRTSPNPLVGAVIVKDGKIVGRGFHKKAGEHHAEINAFNDAGERAKGAALYVNLEPCSHYGRTPPCTRMIIERGISKVFIGMEDPNEVVAGSGIRCLNDNGLFVKTGILKEQCEKLNEIYIKYITTKRPFVILKSAVSLDGKIATKTGDTRWITNEKSRRFLHRLRDQVDGILVGIGTILADDPKLTTRLYGRKGKDPIRVIVDSTLRIPLHAKAINRESHGTTIIVTTEFAQKEKISQLENLGANVLVTNSKDNRVDLNELMSELGKLEITSLLIEGGAEVNASSLENRIVDKVLFFYAPKIIGGVGAVSVVGGEGAESLNDAVLLEHIRVRKFENDILVEGYVRS